MADTLAFLRSPLLGDGDFDSWDFEDDDPQRWVRNLPLYRALAAELPTRDPELGMLRERARHWSTCPVRVSLEVACDCSPAAVTPPVPAGLRRVHRPAPVQRLAEPVAQVLADADDEYLAGLEYDSCSWCGGYHSVHWDCTSDDEGGAF